MPWRRRQYVMSDYFEGHIDLVEFEHRLRHLWTTTPPPETLEKAAIIRGREWQIQAALWLAREIDEGIDPTVLIEAALQAVSTMLKNISRQVVTDELGHLPPLDTMVARLNYLTLEAPSILQGKTRLPIQKGGRA